MSEILVQMGDHGKQVKEIQEYLSIQGRKISIDSDFGSATKLRLEEFQQAHNLSVTGAVDNATYVELIQPLVRATNPIFPVSVIRENNDVQEYKQVIPEGFTLNDMIVRVAQQHLREHPIEVGGQGE